VTVILISGRKLIDSLVDGQCRRWLSGAAITHHDRADQEQDPTDATKRENCPPIPARRRARGAARHQVKTAPVPTPVVVVPCRCTSVSASQIYQDAKSNQPHDETDC
jgi:hypothetical protein